LGAAQVPPRPNKRPTPSASKREEISKMAIETLDRVKILIENESKSTPIVKSHANASKLLRNFETDASTTHANDCILKLIEVVGDLTSFANRPTRPNYTNDGTDVTFMKRIRSKFEKLHKLNIDHQNVLCEAMLIATETATIANSTPNPAPNP
jgi:hypothetical protein